jgi:Ca2+-transporting ATPase
MSAIALAVSTIPEGLLATMTIVMAIGVQKMAREKAIVKKLDTIQTLGNVSVICTDKTGTLTQNKMSAVKVGTYDDFISNSISDTQNLDTVKYKDLINCGVLCNNAVIDEKDPTIIHGDPTEGALLYLATQNNLKVEDIQNKNTRIFELPFDSDRKMMSTINTVDGKTVCFTKGALEMLITKCSHVMENGQLMPLTKHMIEQIVERVHELASQAYRVLGFASKNITADSNEYKNAENDLCFLGSVCLIDPPRPEVIPAIQSCYDAGIKTVMITGDHILTAKAIGQQIGLFKDHHIAIDGIQLKDMDDAQLNEQIQNIAIFARVTPSDKLRIVNAFQKQAEIVAMTGDGVNDAPALKSADIGIAMGKSGTDVAKQSANMLLLDDSFATISKAVYEGRKIFNNLKKVIEFLLTGNVCEVILMLVLTIGGFINPLTAVQILIINLITETVPSLALGLEPAEYNVMATPPLKNNTIFTKAVMLRFAYHCGVVSALSLAAYFIGFYGFDSSSAAMTMTFLTISLTQIFHTFNLKSTTLSVFSKKNKNNRLL